MNSGKKQLYALVPAALLLCFSLMCSTASTEPVLIFTDSTQQEKVLPHIPRRVVSLVPSVTEILLRLGVADALVGTTYHSRLQPGRMERTIVGGFFRPDLDRVEALAPEVIFYAGLHRQVPDRFGDTAVLVQLTPRSIVEGFDHIRLLGRLFGRESEAERIITEEVRQLDVIAKKTKKIPDQNRQRVMRLMGRDRVMAPGDDSFQNDFIRAAGAIAPEFGHKGSIIEVSLEQWRSFNPQLLYGCDGDEVLLELLRRPGWREVDAVRHNRIVFFPCDLTCRAATHSGYFVSWLAATAYEQEFTEMNPVLSTRVVGRTAISLDLDYVVAAELVESDIADFRHTTVALTFSEPMRVVSTLEGQRDNIRVVANHSFPPPSWGIGHRQGLAGLRQSTTEVLGLAPESTAMLFTGADMNNLAMARKSYKELEVIALVTAGVSSNAMRMGVDTGLYYELEGTAEEDSTGTINIILLSNTALSPRAMSRAIITATEAKSAALQDLDIRSGPSALAHQATGTGTDNIIVVKGAGPVVENSGGHTKVGELIAGAVYEAVQKAVYRQNGLLPDRSVFQRLQERGIDLAALCPPALRTDLEHLLLQPDYAAFVKMALTISDAHRHGLIGDLEPFFTWCTAVAVEIAGRSLSPVGMKAEKISAPVIDAALRALVQGLQARIQQKPEQGDQP